MRKGIAQPGTEAKPVRLADQAVQWARRRCLGDRATHARERRGEGLPQRRLRPVEARDRLGCIEEKFWTATAQGCDEIVGHPSITPRRPQERFLALVVERACNDGGDDLASCG